MRDSSNHAAGRQRGVGGEGATGGGGGWWTEGQDVREWVGATTSKLQAIGRGIAER